MILDKNAILANGAKFDTKEIEVPELGGSVYVREVNAKELDRIYVLCSRVKNMPDSAKSLRAEMCAYFLSDENGKRLFSDNQFDMLAQLNGKIMDAIMDAGMAMNSLGEEDDPVGEAEKN